MDLQLTSTVQYCNFNKNPSLAAKNKTGFNKRTEKMKSVKRKSAEKKRKKKRQLENTTLFTERSEKEFWGMLFRREVSHSPFFSSWKKSRESQTALNKKQGKVFWKEPGKLVHCTTASVFVFACFSFQDFGNYPKC